MTLGNLRLLDDAADAEWMREKMLSFADSVGSFLPDQFEATTTAEDCRFARREGFGDCTLPHC